MTSLMTNVAAMTALRTLQSTNSSLEEAQGRISTGYRVAEAKDNAAYWSIATTMRSDNKAMSAIKDSLGIGAATVDTAYTAINSARDVLDEIKAKLTTATQEGVDRKKVQSEIFELQKQLRSIAESASFSGENWLAVDSSTSNFTSERSIVSSFQRDQSGTLSIGTIQVELDGLALFDDSLTGNGILDSGNVLAGGLRTIASAPATAPVSASVTLNAFKGPIKLDADDTISFDIALNGAGSPTTITISRANVADGEITDVAEFVTVLNAAFAATTPAATAATATQANGVVTIASADITSASAVSISNIQLSEGSVVDIDITGATSEDISRYIRLVDAKLEQVITGAASLGAIKNRIDMQTDFVAALMDAVDRGIGTLVDADMTEESTRLKALQTQQQLGVQALSIANQSGQSILQLFQQ